MGALLSRAPLPSDLRALGLRIALSVNVGIARLRALPAEEAAYFLREDVPPVAALLVPVPGPLVVALEEQVAQDEEALVLDQLAAFGVLVGIGLGVQYGTAGSYLVSFVAVLFGALLLAVINPKNPLIPREAVIGIMYGLALVASLLLGDKLPGGGTYVTKTLAGSMLWVTWPSSSQVSASASVSSGSHSTGYPTTTTGRVDRG